MSPDTCEKHKDMEDGIAGLHKKIDLVLDRLGKGEVNFATIKLRLRILELIVYGAVGLSLVSLATSILEKLMV